ncbi:hypothetical protein L917_14296 [Phytophthora nicotianae]|uniref:Uncharacterized protein n=1 Tax=Phytophthora nicotianae TaxID=4792 RepID=W2KNU8_PHYNI|nr:hypothetical protein L916_14482 [Phytophthora nicotianae]ETL86264.1 hypothetical protein L917_14296 [Phytophthora nicotianae]
MQLESVLTKLGLSRGVKRALSDDDLHTFTMYISIGERADHRKDGP